MSLAATLREALERGHRHSPELIAGDVLEGEEADGGITPAAVLVPVVERAEPESSSHADRTSASIRAR